MTMLYWAWEYIKVLLAYSIVMFVWPYTVFYGYLKKKSLTVRFAFCTTVPVLLMNTVVLGLGLFSVLHGWVVILLFYGVFFLVIWKRFRLSPQQHLALWRLRNGTCGSRLFLSKCSSRLGSWCGQKYVQIRKKIRGHELEYGSLVAVVIFGMIYFSYGAFQNVSYGSSDMLVHHSWIDGLVKGKIFSGGIYPEAMHCLVYTIHTAFGISIYSCELFLAGIHSSVILISMYLLLKELFAWRGTAVFALTLFLTIDLKYINAITSMSRLQWTIPQEFGFYTLFLCALFWLRSLKDPFEHRPKGAKAVLRYLYQNENLFLFQMAFAASFAIHFYVTIMALCLCFVVLLVYCFRLFSKKRILYLMAAVVLGLVISAVPMAVAYAEGTPLQGSIGWGINLIKGDEQGGSISQKHTGIQLGQLPQKVISGAQTLYEKGYAAMYTKERANWIVGISIFVCVMWLGCHLFWRIRHILHRKKEKTAAFCGRWNGLLLLVGMSVMMMLVFDAQELGLPALIENYRLCSLEHILICAVVCSPVDMLLEGFMKTKVQHILARLIPLGVAGIYIGTQALGVFHGYLFYNLSRYNQAVNVTNEIMRQYTPKSYTIISPTDELYQLGERSYHEELLLFSQNVETEVNYTIPTKYLFVYVEKNPIQATQYHFFAGPKWLAADKYTSYFGELASQGDHINSGKINAIDGMKPIAEYSLLSDSYNNLDSRMILESHAMQWCENFLKRFPDDIKVYYEDDTFCCYMIRQNPYRLYQLEES